MKTTQRQYVNCSTAPLNNFLVDPTPFNYGQPSRSYHPIANCFGLLRALPGSLSSIGVERVGWKCPLDGYDNIEHQRQESIRKSSRDITSYKTKPYAALLDAFEVSLLEQEMKYFVYNPNSNYVEFRVVLIQWMINVQEECDMQVKTLAIACNLLDRILSVNDVPRGKWQLIALCCILIAAKLEETIKEVPSINKLLKYTYRGYTKEQVIAMERKIVATLDWMVYSVTLIDFIDLHMEQIQADERLAYQPEEWQKLHSLLKIRQQQLIELVLNDYTFNQWRPSVIGACVFAASRIILGLIPRWPTSFRYPMVGFSDLGPCVQYLIGKFEDVYWSI